MEQQLDILTPTQSVNARQARVLTRGAGRWEAHHMSSEGYLLGHYQDGEIRWVKGVNATGMRVFASLDTLAAWLTLHGRTGDFRVYRS